ncbi:MAG: hypothetical protein ACXVJ7_06575 [Acidimicrobiia bacterium]
MERLRARWEQGIGVARRAVEQLWVAARNPRRVVPLLLIVAILAISLPLTATGVTRVARGTMAWRRSSAIHWRRAEATVRRVRIDDGLVVALQYRDRAHTLHHANVFVGDGGGHWIGRTVPIRYDRSRFHRVEIVGLGTSDPLLLVLRAGAPLGAGIAGIVIAIGLWRRRRLVAVSARPIAVLRGSLVAAGAVLAVGVAAWALGTVWDRGWSAVASAAGHLVSTVFGDLLGVFVPLVAFTLGCLVTAWLARYRHHDDDHDDILSNAHRWIDRAAGMVPSPEELRPPVEPPARDDSDRPVPVKD